MFAAIGNGVFRQSVLVPRVGARPAHFASTLSLSAVVLAVSYLFMRLVDVDYSGTDLWLLGATWVGLTVAFEFGFGHYIVKKPWEVLLEDYNPLKGRIWILVLAVTFLAPFVADAIVRWSA